MVSLMRWVRWRDWELVTMPWLWHKLHLPEVPGKGRNRRRIWEATVRARQRAKARAEQLQARANQLQERFSTPENIVARDKMGFTVGVLLLMITEYMAVSQLPLLKHWYAFLVIILYLLRMKVYHTEKLHYFLIDFCYVGNFLTIFFLYLYPNSVVLFQVCFSLNTGPIAVAILAWRNSLVFHSIDKLTTCVIHVLPPLIAFNLRWYPAEMTNGQLILDDNDDDVSWFRIMALPLVVYLYWQICYILKTEVTDSYRLRNNKGLWTSARWLSRQTKGIVHDVVVMRGKQDEKVNHTLMGVQLIYTAVTILPMKLFYTNKIAHGLYLLFMLIMCVHNGASFYFDVFSRKYIHQVMEQSKQEEQDAIQKEEERLSSVAPSPSQTPNSSFCQREVETVVDKS